MKIKLLLFSLLLVVLFSGCFSDFQKEKEDPKILTHVVFCWLKEPGNSEQREQIIEMTESFNRIPTVLKARAGNPIMSERSIVDDSFDVGIIVEVRDEDGLKEYLDHPIHQKAKKEVLLPLIDRVLVYDFAK
tara:strand:- start:804 stop:1199 length:396 start_codon:yes stop_codon:yes gene_type:complete